MPKSRSMRMSETTSTREAGDRRHAGGEHRARRSSGRCARSASPTSWPAARSWRKRSDSSTLNSVEIAITSAPSVDRHRVQRDARARTARAPTSRSRARSARAARARARARRKTREQHERDRRAGRRAASAARRHGDASVAFASAASTGSPASRALHARRRVELGAHRLDHVAAGARAASGGCRTRASRPRGRGVSTACEKYGGTASSSASIARCAARAGVAEEVGQREGRAQRRACRSPSPRCSRSV